MFLSDALSVDPILSLTLKILSGVCWTLAYILIIRRGVMDKYYGMPVAALCANLSWEFIFSFILPHSKPQLYIDYTWLFFDVGILIQYLAFGKREFPSLLPRSWFYPAFLLTFITTFFAILMASYEFADKNGIYAAFAQNLMMSILFIFMLIRRGNGEGQSVYIATLKMIGTVFPSILFYKHYPHSYLLTFLYIGIFTFDVIYLVLLYRILLREGKNPWKRV